MKKTLLTICIAAMYTACFAGKTTTLESGFITPADSVKTSVYWYWISDNISKDGVVRDLNAMKKVGINRAFIGNIGLNAGDPEYGKVKFMSPEWWEVTHAALKTATELGIEIGMFNSPGWSQSGGPWVKPEQAMRYLSSSEATVIGGKKITLQLTANGKDFQDVKVVAYPMPQNYMVKLNGKDVEVSSSLTDIKNVVDGQKNTSVKGNGNFSVDLKAQKPFTARSLAIHTTKSQSIANCELQAKDASGKFVPITDFKIDRYNFSVGVGFDPLAPVVVSFEDVTSNEFRLIFKGATKDFGMTEIELSAMPLLANYPEKTLAKMFQSPLPYWHEYQWAKQAETSSEASIIDPKKVIDLTANFKNGTLTWNAPKGHWVVLRTGMVPTMAKNSPAAPEATGLEVDKMSKKHIEAHFDAFLGEILRRIPAEDRKSFKVVVQDSYETGGQNMTDTMLEDFKARYGYDATPFLPVYGGKVVGTRQQSDRFLWDMRRLIADKVAYDYVAGLREVSHKNGLTTWLENYGHWGFPGEFLQYGGQSDEIGGEFWSYGELGNIENRAASSCGHIYGKQKISAESFTCGPDKPYSRYPAQMKQRGDRFFAEGINNTLLHVSIQQPDENAPGMNAWFGNEFNRHNTWFPYMDLFTGYLKRTNYMLQQGLNIADAAYFIGEDAPKMTGVTDPELPAGYQFDYINAEVIVRDMSVKDGLLTLPHGTQYRILVLPKLETMRPELLAKIKSLVNEGGVVLGPAPKYSPSGEGQPTADLKVTAMSAELWGNVDGVKAKSRKYGKGMIINGFDMTQAFALLGVVPDFKVASNNDIHYGHRQVDGTDIYFVSNQTDKQQVITPEFRVTGKQPELWSAINGSKRSLTAFNYGTKTTAVPMQLAPYESAFIVFETAGKPSSELLEANYPTPTVISELNSDWNVNFDQKHIAPKGPIKFATLTDWATNNDELIKYYSGEATYSNSFELKNIPNGVVEIDLGEVNVMAKVYVNGQYAGGAWTAPYVVDITKFVRNGKNEVRVDVVNTWVNRLIGDAKLPADKRTTKTPINPYNANSQLQKSGLAGPVKIQSVAR